MRARAIETGAFVLAAAQGGTHEDGRATWGRSTVVDPWGKVIAALDHDRPGILHASLDLDAVDRARHAIPALGQARLMRAWIGLETYVADRMPVVGPLPGMDDAFIIGERGRVIRRTDLSRVGPSEAVRRSFQWNLLLRRR